jgi:hypothetical protein
MPGGIALTPSLQIPIGGIVAWLKSYANTPALPPGWVEPNGQVLNDAESVYNGQTLPDLNGGNRFLRGNAASGETGGAATHSHSVSGTTGYPSQCEPATTEIGAVAAQYHRHDFSATTTAEINLPPYYNVVWIMRVK